MDSSWSHNLGKAPEELTCEWGFLKPELAYPSEEELSLIGKTFRCWLCGKTFAKKKLRAIVMGEYLCGYCVGITDEWEIFFVDAWDRRHGFPVRNHPVADLPMGKAESIPNKPPRQYTPWPSDHGEMLGQEYPA
jgi:hypothetical protein